MARNSYVTYTPTVGNTRLIISPHKDCHKGHLIACYSDDPVKPGTVMPLSEIVDEFEAGRIHEELVIGFESPDQARAWSMALEKLAEEMAPKNEKSCEDSESCGGQCESYPCDDDVIESESRYSFWGSEFICVSDEDKMKMIFDACSMKDCPLSLTRSDLHLMLKFLVDLVTEDGCDDCDDCDGCEKND